MNLVHHVLGHPKTGRLRAILLVGMASLLGAGLLAATPAAAQSCTTTPPSGVSDGLWAFAGCFTQSGTNYLTMQPASLDGLLMTPAPSSTLTFTTVGSLKLTGSGTVSLNLPSIAASVPITGPTPVSLDLDLSKSSWTVSVPSGTTVVGLELSDKVTLYPQGGTGTVMGTVPAQLPGFLGGGKGSLSFTSTLTNSGNVTNSGISAMTLGAVTSGQFLHLVKITNVTVSFGFLSGELTVGVGATATTASGQSSTFQGTATWQNGVLSGASVTIPGMTLLGLVTLNNFTVTYSQGAWSGTATVSQPGSNVTPTVNLAFDANGNLISGSIVVNGPMTLFGVLPLQYFALTYLNANGTGNWGVDVQSTIANSPIETSLRVTGGIITGATISLGNVNFLNLFTLDSAKLEYSNANNGTWKGTIAVTLPSSVVSGIKVSLTFEGGSLISGKFEAKGNVGPIWGTYLHKLGAGLTWSPPILQASGTVGLTFGPTVNNTAILGLEGTLAYASPSTPGCVPNSETYCGCNPTVATCNVFTLAASGTATAPLVGTFGSGYATVTYDGTNLTTVLNLGLGPNGNGLKIPYVPVTLTGSVSGTFGNGLSLTGTADLTMNAFGVEFSAVSGQLAINQNGMAECVSYAGITGGFVWNWGSYPALQGPYSCSTANY